MNKLPVPRWARTTAIQSIYACIHGKKLRINRCRYDPNLGRWVCCGHRLHSVGPDGDLGSAWIQRMVKRDECT